MLNAIESIDSTAIHHHIDNDNLDDDRLARRLDYRIPIDHHSNSRSSASEYPIPRRIPTEDHRLVLQT